MATNNAINANSTTPLAIVNGGTAVNAVTTAPTSIAFAGWDANSNLSANNMIEGFVTTVTAAGTTTLTVASKYTQEFTGSTTQTVVMPVTSTLIAGQSFFIVNNSTGVVTINSSGANLILSMAANTSAFVTCVLNSGTTAVSWNATYIVDSGGGVSPGTQNQLGYYAITGNNISGLSTANNGVLVTSGASVPSISSTLPADLTIPTPIIAQINDANGNEMLSLSGIASAVNFFNITNSITGASPSINAVGDDANAGFIWATKGTGQLQLNSANTTTPVVINSGTALQHSTNFVFSNTAATRTVTFPDATGTLLMTGVAINTVPSIAFSSTSGIIGTTTNNNAAAGSVGEIIESTVLVASAVALTNGATANITTITLTNGDWTVWGTLATNPSVGTTQTRVITSISTTSATLPTVPNGGAYNAVSTAAVATVSNILPTGEMRISVAGSTTVYLLANVSFAVSTLTGYGYLGARRVR